MRSPRRTRRRAGLPRSVHPREQLVDPAVRLRIELLVVIVGAAHPAPAPHADGEHTGAAEDAADRQPPREEIEALVRRRGEDPLPEVGDELVLDLLRAPALRDAAGDLRLDLLRGRRLRHVERRVAGRAHDLALEIRERRLRMRAGRRRAGEHERRRGRREEAERHWSSAARIPRSKAATWFVIVPMMCEPTSLPLRSMKKVSGTPVSPYLSPILPEPSCTIGYVTPWCVMNVRASPTTFV